MRYQKCNNFPASWIGHYWFLFSLIGCHFSLIGQNFGTLYCTLLSFTQICVVASTHIACVAVVWISVIIGMNRYIAVCWPLQAARLCTISRVKKELCVVFFSIAHAPPRFFRYNLTQSVDGSRYMVTKLIKSGIKFSTSLAARWQFVSSFLLSCCSFCPCAALVHFVRPENKHWIFMEDAVWSPGSLKCCPLWF